MARQPKRWRVDMLSTVGDVTSKRAAEKIAADFGIACRDGLAHEGAAVNLACAHILGYFKATQYDTQISLQAPQVEGVMRKSWH